LRERLGELPVEPDRPASPLFVRATGGILDLPALLRSAREAQAAPAAELGRAEALLRRSPGVFQKVRFAWGVGRETAEAEVRIDLPDKGVVSEGALTLGAPGLRDALQDARRLVKAHPEQATAHAALSFLLLRAGAGTAAREEARRAAALAPEEAVAHLQLALVLEHDRLGRLWRAGFDYDGAEAALRQAKKLDPRRYDVRVELALLLLRGRRGQHAISEMRVMDAMDEIRFLREQLSRGELKGRADERLLEAEFFAGQHPDLLLDAPSIPSSEVRDVFILVSRLTTGGREAALDEVRRIRDTAARAKLLIHAARFLEGIRSYGPAAELFEAVDKEAPGGEAASRSAARDRKLASFEERVLPQSHPSRVVEAAVVAAYDPWVAAADLMKFVAAESSIPPRTVRGTLLPVSPERRADLLAAGLTAAYVRDFFRGLSQIRVDGDRDSGWRVEVRPDGDANPDLWWLIDERGAPKILCRSRCTGPLGVRALAMVETGKPELARRILDWARDALPKDLSQRDAPASLFASVWNGGPGTLVLAAAVAAAGGTQSGRAIRVLTAAVKSGRPALRDRIRVALGLAQLHARNEEAALRSIEGIDPAAVPEARSVRISALLELKRFADAAVAVDEWLRLAPDDSFALWYAMRLGMATDNLERIDGAARKLVALQKYTAEAQNNLAWAKYCHGRLDEDAVQLAEASSRSGRSVGAINTLATLYAETGRLEEARETVLRSIDAHEPFHDERVLSFSDRYVLARIWEGYGLEDLALPEYRELSFSNDKASHDRECVAAAARRRLAEAGRAVQ
jgi:tetratricopeptide (TPR) repeat protein